MSLNNSLGAGMAQVASNAILADSIARQASALANARDSLQDMAQYATRLEGNVRQLYQIVVQDGELIDALKEDLEAVTEQRDKLARQNTDLLARIERFKLNDIAQYEKYERQVEYMRDLKERLKLTEEALQHASGLGAAGEMILERLVAVDSERADDHHIARNQAYAAFCASGRLAISDKTQKRLEDMKAKAPDFKQGVAN